MSFGEDSPRGVASGWSYGDGGWEPPQAENRPYRPERDDRPGAGWALGFMPLATLVVQLIIACVMWKSIDHGSTALVAPLGVLTWLCGLGGLVLVYSVTQDFTLTVGYLVVRWIESFLMSLVLTTAVLASLGIHTGAAHTSAPAASAPTYPPAPTSSSSSAINQDGRTFRGLPAGRPPSMTTANGLPTTPGRTALNNQGLRLNVTAYFDRHVDVEVTPQSGPDSMTVQAGGRRVPLQNSTVSLTCYGADNTGISFTQRWPASGLYVLWRTTLQVAAGMSRCDGTVRPQAGGPRYPLHVWTLSGWGTA